jgi:flagellar L-ring protein precursor FlgH
LPQQLAAKNPTIDPTQLIKASTARTWDGEGTTSRKGRLSARMTATVTAVSPTGNLWIQGEKVVAVNKEDQHIVVQGWVRPEDIDAQNQVLSTRLADAGRVLRRRGAGCETASGVAVLDARPVWPF